MMIVHASNSCATVQHIIKAVATSLYSSCSSTASCKDAYIAWFSMACHG
jgi:hypothetical protein